MCEHPKPHPSRRSYHTDFVAAAQAGALAPAFRRGIPRSTLSGFRRRDLSRITGLEHAQVFALIRELQSLHDIRRTTAILSAVVRISHLVKSLGLPFQAISHTKLPAVRRKVVELVKRLSDRISREKVLALLGISPARFASWVRQRAACPSSPLSLCRRSVLHQLTKTEVCAINNLAARAERLLFCRVWIVCGIHTPHLNRCRCLFSSSKERRGAAGYESRVRIKRKYSDPANTARPAVSIAWNLINSRLVSANVATIIRYAKIMGLDAIRKVKRKPRKRGSFTAERPNQAWHMDVTTVITADNRKTYVQLVLDNFSRKIIAWKASTSISGLSSSQLLASAFANLTQTPQEDISLIVDGGPENNNRHVEAWLKGVPVKKLIAQVDVSFSNSMIEAVNKILKYRYLFRKHIRDFDHFLEVFPADVTDYNARPHYALRGLSPDDAHDGKVFDREDYERRLREARKNRLRENRAERHPCEPWDEKTSQQAGGEGKR